jgi:hypothetical protein
MPRKKPLEMRKHGNKYQTTIVLAEENARHIQKRAEQLNISVSAAVNACIELDRSSVSSELAVQLVKMLKTMSGMSPEKIQALCAGDGQTMLEV